MTAIYSKSSPYINTPMWGPFLDTWYGKTIPTGLDDAIYQIRDSEIVPSDINYNVKWMKQCSIK